jgi:type II secretion system protein N
VSRLKLLGALAGYGLWFVGLYLALTWLTFPWSRIEDQAIVAASDAGWALEFGDLGSAFFGVWTEDMSLSPAPPQEGENEQTPSGLLGVLLGDGIKLDYARLKMPMTQLLPAGLTLRGALSDGGLSVGSLLDSAGRIDLDARFWDGELALDVLSDPGSTRIEVDARDISLKDYALRVGFISADPQGILRSKGTIVWDKEDPKKSSGGLDLFLDSLIIPGLPIVGDVAFSKSEGHIKLTRGRAELRDTSLEADELQAVVEGFVTLSKNIERSRLSLKLRFAVRDDLDPLVNGAMMGNTRHKDEDGWYHYQVSGTLAKPRFRPSAAAARRGKRSPTKPRKEPADLGEDDTRDEPQPTRTNDSGLIERPSVSKSDREDADSRREQLREERARRREERKERREEMMRKRRERQDDLGASGAARPTLDNDAFMVPDDIMPSQEGEGEGLGVPGEDELEDEGNEENEGNEGNEGSEGNEGLEDEEGDYEE